MRRVALIAAAVLAFGSGPAFAQVGITRNAPAMRAPSLLPMRAAPAVPGTAPRIGTGSNVALGTIPSTLGTSATIAGGAVGSITPCTMSGSAATAPFNATFADPITGALPPQPLPGATLPPAYAFGPSTTTGACNPAAATTAIIEALGASVDVTIPGLASTTTQTYTDATIPPTAVESGAAGLSPQLIVPTPVPPSISPGFDPTQSLFSGDALPSAGMGMGAVGP